MNSNDLLNWGVEVLSQEAKAINLAATRLNLDFAKAVNFILQCKGKVVCTGLGKSGYIARKMASTMASTGTSSFYLHPAEALHGDFGMLDRNDCLVAFAYGGETREVIAVAKFAKESSVPVIAITGKLDSTLANIADVTLNGSVEKEADSLGLAPTSSSTVALALADALSVAVMKARGFTKKDFANLHPGGSLGRSLSNVLSYMKPVSELPMVKIDDCFHKVLQSVTNPNYGIVAVVDDQLKIVGAISDGDLRRALLKHSGEALNLKAKDLLSKNPKTVNIHSLVMEAFSIMEEKKITVIFVVDDEQKYAGLLRMHDLISSKVV